MPEIIRIILTKYVFYFNVFISCYLAFYALVQLISTIYGALHILREAKLEYINNELLHEYYYPMSVMIPVYNEGKTGVQTVENVLKQDYKLFEVVIIDDGSKDDTKQLIIDKYSLKREYDRPIRYAVPCQPILEVYEGQCNGHNILLISKKNGGCKADAINAAINVCNYPYVVNMDGDEILQKDALTNAARAIMEDDNVVGVGGNLRISNSVEFRDAKPVKFHIGRNILADIQTLEYGRNFAGSRILHNNWNANLTISGGYGVFKKSTLIEVGGYDTKSMGEDLELTMRIHEYYKRKKQPYLMKYVEDSVCWTQAPATFHDLKKQRERWQYGLIQTMAKFRKMILNPRYGMIGMLMLPFHIMYELLAPTIMVLGWLAILFSVVLDNVNLPYVIYVYIVYVLFSLVLTILSYVGNCYRQNERVSIPNIITIVALGLFESFFVRIVLSFFLFIATFNTKKTSKTWVSPKRVEIKDSEED